MLSAATQLWKQVSTSSSSVLSVQTAGTIFPYIGISLYSPLTWSLKLDLPLAHPSSEKFLSQHAGSFGQLEIEWFFYNASVCLNSWKVAFKHELGLVCTKAKSSISAPSICGEIVSFNIFLFVFWAWLPCNLYSLYNEEFK